MPENNNIRVIETPDLAVEITVSGPRSVIDYLGGEDITVKAETYLIQTAGPAVLNISVSKTNKNADFEITGYTPSTVTVQCDYWDTVDLPVRMDISSVQVEDRIPSSWGAYAGQDLFPKQYGQAGRAACHGEPDHVHCREGRGG